MSPCDSPPARQRRAVIWRSESSSRPFGISPALPLHRPIKRAPVRFYLDRRCCTGGVRSQISTPHARSRTRRSYSPALANWRSGPGFRATRRRCTLASAISDQQSQDRPRPSRNIGCGREHMLLTICVLTASHLVFDAEVAKEQFHRTERTFVSFTRRFALRPTVDARKVTTEYNGRVC